MADAGRPADALEQASDEILVGRAADGDVRAFAVIVRRYGRRLRAYAARVLGSATGSDDAVQEALIIAWQQLPTLQDPTQLRAWLTRIVTRKAIDALRAFKPHADVDDDALHLPAPTDEEPAQQTQAATLETDLSHALETLPVQQRHAWVLRELGGYSYTEIAEELALPVSTVRGLLARARTRLLHDMQDWR